MMLIKVILVLCILPFVDVKIYVFNTADSPSVELYDCILQDGLFYCRRPTEPIPLNRNSSSTIQCHQNGTRHSFADLRKDNVSISTVLHKFKSSMEKVELYSRYMRNSSELDDYVCNCTKPQSFGKNCEYLLPMGTTFAQTVTLENNLKRYNPRYVQEYGDVVCYKTLKCNSGLLCLDWRDICDGVQQCMSGLDEENCDKLEFNECEDDEYRCMNGMCVPEEYFLDGEFDCLDWSDEIQYYDDANCPIEAASAQCDDRMCPPNKFSCGDGQCIFDRFEFQKLSQIKSECRSRREQYYICETHYAKKMWTLPNGRCYEDNGYNESNVDNYTIYEKCEYYLRCDLSGAAEAHCPCGQNSSCAEQLNNTCRSGIIQYPKAGIMAPYMLFYYYRTRNISSYRPNFTWLNGTIKCDGVFVDIPGIRFQYISTLRQVEDQLCRWTINGSLLNNRSSDEYCHNQSLTFSNLSYSLSDVCNKSKKCISTYRIKDGFINCVDKMDEIGDSSIPTICSKMQRYRFRCSTNEPTCLSVTALGNLQNDCKNKFDELWLGTSTQIADINCNKIWKDQCEILRQYISNSWMLNNTNQVATQFRIPFRHYCDTFWNLALKEDENVNECREWWVCPDEQWRCDTGQCIDGKWVLDGEWDCFDASDEDNLNDQFISHRNLQVVPFPTLKNRSIKLNRPTPFSSICNLMTEFPCLPVNVSNLPDNSSYNRPCINQDRIGDSRIDCYGAIDERNTITHCNQPSMLGYNFKCMSTNDCIPYWNHCFGDRCNSSTDDSLWCNRRQNPSNYDSFNDSICFNGTFVTNGRCNRVLDCHFGEDEYMCEYQSISKSTGVLYRNDKYVAIKKIEQKLRLNGYPTDSQIITQTPDPNSIISTTLTVTPLLNDTIAPIAYSCNRGVGIYMYNGSIVCFCPPQYYGDKCQFHSDRITVLVHLNLSQSIYTIDSDIKIVLKFVILFLFEKEIITNEIFHVRPVSDLFVYTKKMNPFLYSRSFRLLQNKTQGYFDQPNIGNNHSYSVRIEMYERKDSGEPLLIGIWQYPIYFDYLPVFRLAKVLRLTKPDMEKNPCSSNPCNQNQDCQQIINDGSKYICLCKDNFTGENCSIEDQQCAEGYCLHGSICKPNYRGLLVGNKLPYCICLFDYFGERCHIQHEQCSSTPCQHNGTCYATSKPDTFSCICTEEYHGNNCELRKPEVKLYINQSVSYAAAVVQYFEIDFILLRLIPVYQQFYRTLPTLLEYRHGQKTAPEIILVKLYSSQIEISFELYLISVHIDAISIYATTQMIEQNRCVDIRTLISSNDTQVISNYSPIKYHSLCQNNTNLFCFRDDFYLCICDENHTRVECFPYDYTLDGCSYCLAGGRCLKGNRQQPNDFICVCPPCHSGTKCQFNSNSFAFTLDQLFYTDLISTTNQKPTVGLLIIIPILLFLLAIPNNLFSIITFRRQNCLCNGIGQYLLYMSMINQLNLGLLAARLIHLSLNITGLHSNPLVDHYLCKILSYLLTTSGRMVYWLSSLVAIERVYMTLFLNGRWLRKPHIARRLIIFTVISILISDIHEIIFVKSLFGINNDKGSMCVIEFPINSRSTWLLFHLILSIMNSILPLLINICCTITISYVVAKTKINTRKRATILDDKTTTHESRLTTFRTQLHFIFEVLSENKELVIGPGITVVPQLFSLPLFVISFTLYCRNLESSWVRYLLIASYFTSSIPQLISFMLYILPSSFYSTEWRSTKIGRWVSGVFRYSPPVPVIIITSETTN